MASNNDKITVPETPNTHLMPERHPVPDLFICDVHDAVLKDITEMMEHPFYSLSKKPETTIRRYEHNGDWLEVTPSVKGLATIYDKDILIYAISQLMAKLNRQERVGRRVRINTHELLQFTNRGTAGKDYEAISEAIDRLAGTRIVTNIRKNGEERHTNFGLIDSGTVVRKDGMNGRLLWLEIDIADWIFDAIRESAVLTLHRDYFRLRKPLERRLYELARKHCGQQPQWKASVELLHKKSGSKSPLKKFRFMVRDVVDNDHLPDYMVEFLTDKDQVLFVNRGTMPPAKGATVAPSGTAADIIRRLDPDIGDKARPLVPGWDLHHIKNCFGAWWVKIGCPDVRSADGFFLKFCRSFYAQNGQP